MDDTKIFTTERAMGLDGKRSTVTGRDRLLEVDVSEVEKILILRARAQKLSQEIEEEKDAKENLELTEFKLATEHYGIETRFIQEVHPLKEYTPLPCAPAYVFGILNIRGKIVSVINLKRFFGLPERGLSDLNKVIILHNESMVFGILADEIIGVRQLPMSSVRSGLPTLKDARVEYLLGVADDRLVILDGEKLLASEHIIVNEEVRP